MRGSAHPLVELGHEATPCLFHRRLEVHDLVGDVELMVDGLGRSAIKMMHMHYL